jgi:hypothetical protein
MNKIVRDTSATPEEQGTALAAPSRSTSRIGNRLCMTEYPVAARAAIILWTNLAVMLAEILFDAIEAELKRRGVEADG